jgi:hypothetical protein
LPGDELLRPNVAEDGCDRNQTGLPTLRVEMMDDLFAVIVRLLMLAHEAQWERATTPLAAVRLPVHAGQRALEVGGRHVVAAG